VNLKNNAVLLTLLPVTKLAVLAEGLKQVPPAIIKVKKPEEK
jgi:hypothetical protein